MNLKLLTSHVITMAVLLMWFSAPVQADGKQLQSLGSAKDYAQTVVALRATLNGSSNKIFQEIDHHNSAMGMNVELSPSRVFIFGNPKVGTRLIQCAPLVALDLPQRMLVRRDSDGKTQVYWAKASTLLARYSTNLSEDCQALATEVDEELAELAAKAASGD